MGLVSHAASGVKWTGLSTAFTVGAQVVSTTVLARCLYPEEYGLMAMAMLVAGFGQTYADLGIGAAIVHRQDSTRNELSSLYWLNLCTGAIICCLLWLASPGIGVVFKEPRVGPVIRALSLMFLIIPTASEFEILLQKGLQFHTVAKVEIAASVTGTAVAITCATAKFGVWALVYGFLTTVTVKAFLLLVAGRQGFLPSWHFCRADLRNYIGFGMFQIGERSVNYVSDRLDQLLIGPLLGVTALGYYNFAFNLTAQVIWRINPILTRVAFPIFSKVQNDTEKIRWGYGKLLTILTSVNAPLLIGLAAVAPSVVPLAFGARWTQAVPLIQILSLVSLFRSVGNPIGSVQLAKGRADLGFWWNLGVLVLSLPVIYLGARWGQALGVCVALLAFQVATAVPAYLLLVRPVVGRCAKEYAAALLQPVLAASLMAGLVAGLRYRYRPLGRALLTEVAIEVALGALVYIVALATFCRGVVRAFRGLVWSA